MFDNLVSTLSPTITQTTGTKMRTLKEDIQRTEMAEKELKSALNELKLDNSDDTKLLTHHLDMVRFFKDIFYSFFLF